jgi:hypothetical protein
LNKFIPLCEIVFEKKRVVVQSFCFGPTNYPPLALIAKKKKLERPTIFSFFLINVSESLSMAKGK